MKVNNVAIIIAAVALEAAAAPNPVPSPEALAQQAPDITSLMSSSGISGATGISANDIKSGSFQCKKVALLFARGTGEPGNLGMVVGGPFSRELKKKFGANEVLVQGSDYYTTFTNGASTDFVKWVPQIKSKCPNTHVILSGYSQGAMNVHSALSKLGQNGKMVTAAVTFGDPYGNMGFGGGGMVGTFMGMGGSSSFNPQNGLAICSTTDFVCAAMPNWNFGSKAQGNWSKTSNSAASHLSYMMDDSTVTATNFVAKIIGGAGASTGAAAPSGGDDYSGSSGASGLLSKLGGGSGASGLLGKLGSGAKAGAAAPAAAAPAAAAAGADSYA